MSIEHTIDKLLTDLIDPITQLTLRDLGLKYAIEQSGHSLQIQLLAGFPCKSLKKQVIRTGRKMSA